MRAVREALESQWLLIKRQPTLWSKFTSATIGMAVFAALAVIIWIMGDE